MRRKRPILAVLILSTLWLISGIPALPGSDWLQFRGPGSSGTGGDGEDSPASTPPLTFGAENIAWKADLPGRGVSSPIVVSGRVVVTCSSGYRQDRLHVLCFDAREGRKLWERQFWATGRTMCHPKTCMAAPTPASDGKRILAFYSTNDLFSLDLEGNLLWLRGLTRDYPNASVAVGMASSPLVAGDLVVVQVENDCQSFAAGLDLETGINRWKIDRPRKPNWSSPVILPGQSPADDVLVLQSWSRISGHEPATGREVWNYPEDCHPIPSSTPGGGVLYVPSGGLTALRPAPGETAPRVLWKSSRLRPGTSSPLVYRGNIYIVTGNGILSCGDPANGEIIWRLRLQGPVSSSPVASGGYIFIVSEKGLIQVVKTGEEGKLEGSTDLKETILCTPALTGGALYLRSDRHLYKFAGNPGK